MRKHYNISILCLVFACVLLCACAKSTTVSKESTGQYGVKTAIKGDTVKATAADGRSYSFAVQSLPDPEGGEPLQGDGITPAQAVERAVPLIVALYPETAKKTTVSVQLYNVVYDAPHYIPTYELYFGGTGYDTAFCMTGVSALAGDGGEPRYVISLFPGEEEAVTNGLDFDLDANYKEEYATRAMELSKALIAERIDPSGTILEDSFVDGRQVAYGSPDLFAVDSRIHMAEGACYTAQYLMPSGRLSSFNVYPLGWHSCLYGYTDPAEEKMYPSLDGTWTWEDAEAYEQSYYGASEEQTDAAETDDTKAESITKPSADPIGDFIKNVQPAQFMPMTVPTRVIRNPEAVSDCVTVTYDATVTIPDATAYSIVKMEKQPFTDDRLAKLCKLFNVSEDTEENQYSSSESNFYYCRYANGYVTRKTWVRYELDWQPEDIALFDDSIPLSRSETQPVAEKILADMGAGDYVLDEADEAIMMSSDAQGKTIAVSKGWQYAFVPQSDGLPRHSYGGRFGSDRDPVFYCNAWSSAYIWIYVDDQGVSCVSWMGGARTGTMIEENVAPLPLDTVIRLANERFARMYQQNAQFDGHFAVHVQNIRLAAMLLGNTNDAEDVYSVPVWEMEYTVATDNEYRRLCVLPFNAVDGGAVEAIEFPF